MKQQLNFVVVIFASVCVFLIQNNSAAKTSTRSANNDQSTIVHPTRSPLKPNVYENIFTVSAFEKIDVKRFAMAPSPQMNHYSKAVRSVMLIKNIAFGVFGAGKVAMNLNLEEDTKSEIQLHLDNENGHLISTIPITKNASSSSTTVYSSVEPVKGYHDLYVSYSGDIKPTNITWFQFDIAGPNPEEFYVITSLLNGQALGATDLTTTATVSNTNVAPYTYGLHQMFRFVKSTIGSYYISARHSKKYLEVRNGAFVDNTPVNLNGLNASQTQEWYIDPAGEGSVKIMSRLTGKCATVYPSSTNYLYQKSCNNSSDQKWYFMPVC